MSTGKRPIRDITTEDELDDVLSTPPEEVISLMKRLDGYVMILGAGGKMGPTLSVMAARAAEAAGSSSRIIAVSRFSDQASRKRIASHGVETIECDLLARDSLDALPEVANIILMAGRKFGTEGRRELTWAVNVMATANALERFPRSRFVVFSTGCVYPLVDGKTGGCTEETEPEPVGEYAQSCLARERIAEYFSSTNGTPVCLFRLNYAIDLRYGVLHDIARRVFEGKPISISAPYFNAVWQGDACARALLCLERCTSPPTILNITGTEVVSTRDTAVRFGEIFGKEATVKGTESRCYLSDASKAAEIFGEPETDMDRMIELQAKWLLAGGSSLDKPTHFETTDGKF